MSLVVGAAYGIPTVALRFFNVYGPGQALSNPYTGVAAIFASRLLNGRPPVIFEDGAQSRDFIHVSDIVAGILLALESEQAPGHAINLGTGRPTTVADVAYVISRGMGLKIEPERNEQYRAGDIRHCFADVEQARELLGFEAKTTFEAGMAELVGWLEDQEAVDGVEAATQELAERGLTR
jgi:dTDP-L-rhamnose 4-epimerase